MPVRVYKPKQFHVEVVRFDRRSGTYDCLVDGIPCVLAKSAHSGHMAAGRRELLYGRLFSDGARRVLIALDQGQPPALQDLESRAWYALFLLAKGDGRGTLQRRPLETVFRSAFLEQFPQYRPMVLEMVSVSAGNAASAALSRLEKRCASSTWDSRSEAELRYAIKWLAFCGAHDSRYEARLGELEKHYKG